MFNPVGRVGEFIVSDGEPARPVFVNLNTCTQFQVWYGSSLLSVIPSLLSTLSSARVRNEDTGVETMSIVALASLDLRALHILGAAALHRYRGKEPVFDLTPGELGASLTFEQWADLFKVLIKGIGDFLPKAGDGPPQMESNSERPTNGGTHNNPSGMNGGPPSTHSHADILATLTLNSDEQHLGQSGSDGELTNSPNVIKMSGR